MQTLRSIAAAFVMALLIGNQAFAHANLKAAEPANEAIVSSPSALNLTFSEKPNLQFSKVELIDADGKSVETEEPMLMDSGKTIMVPVFGVLKPGIFNVDWSVLSVDGHKIKGSYTFTVKP